MAITQDKTQCEDFCSDMIKLLEKHLIFTKLIIKTKIIQASFRLLVLNGAIIDYNWSLMNIRTFVISIYQLFFVSFIYLFTFCCILEYDLHRPLFYRWIFPSMLNPSLNKSPAFCAQASKLQSITVTILYCKSQNDTELPRLQPW